MYVEKGVCTATGRSEIRVTKPDGTLCFTYVVSGVYSGQECENGSLSWTNAAGEVVATGNFHGGLGFQETVTCTGSSVSWSCGDSVNSPNCPGSLGAMDCSRGTCP
jgi:hypothetical protein